MGQNIDLVYLELPKFGLQATISKFFPLPVLPAIGVELGGTIKGTIDWAFGYDTSGIRSI